MYRKGKKQNQEVVDLLILTTASFGLTQQEMAAFPLKLLGTWYMEHGI